MEEVSAIDNKQGLSSERIQELEKVQILNHRYLEDWHFTERESPAFREDAYAPRYDRQLHDYYFYRDNYVHISMKFEFFSAPKNR